MGSISLSTASFAEGQHILEGVESPCVQDALKLRRNHLDYYDNNLSNRRVYIFSNETHFLRPSGYTIFYQKIYTLDL